MYEIWLTHVFHAELDLVAEPSSASFQEDGPALMPDGRVNVLAVEDHMARVVWQQWQHFITSSGVSTDAGVKESMLQASAVPVRITC